MREGSVSLRLRQYGWKLFPDTVWSERIRESQKGVLTIEVPATGLYRLRLSYFSFAGSVVIDWDVE